MNQVFFEIRDMMGSYIVPSIAAIASILAILISLVSFIQARRAARDQRKAQSQAFLLRLDTTLMKWGDECIDTIAALEALFRAPVGPDTQIDLAYGVSKISGLIDKGRLFMPNEHRGDQHGAKKLAAYQGHRPIVLDRLHAIFEYCRAISAEEITSDEAHELFKLRREFVNELTERIHIARSEHLIRATMRDV